MEIIPAIIAKDLEDLKNKVDLMKNQVQFVQIDIMDGRFVENKTWNDPEKLKNVDFGSLKYEVHLMDEEPRDDVEKWLKSDAFRILVHIESQADFKELSKIVHAKNKQFGLVLNPDTPLSILENFKDVIDVVQLMSVYPGKYGAEFIPAILEKGEEFKKLYSRTPLSIDGGVNEKTLPKIIKAGFDRAAAGSAIFESKDSIKSL